MASNQFKINQEILENILKNVLLSKGALVPENNDHIFNIIMRELPDHAKEYILHLSLAQTKYKPVKLSGYVMVEPPSYHAGDKFEWDILEDMGLVGYNSKNNQEKYVYGKVTGDSSWGSGPFNPFYCNIKVELLYHDKEKKMELYDHSVSPLELINVSISKIKYFDILATDSEPIHHTAIEETKIEDNGKDINGAPTD